MALAFLQEDSAFSSVFYIVAATWAAALFPRTSFCLKTQIVCFACLARRTSPCPMKYALEIPLVISHFLCGDTGSMLILQSGCRRRKFQADKQGQGQWTHRGHFAGLGSSKHCGCPAELLSSFVRFQAFQLWQNPSSACPTQQYNLQLAAYSS